MYYACGMSYRRLNTVSFHLLPDSNSVISAHVKMMLAILKDSTTQHQSPPPQAFHCLQYVRAGEGLGNFEMSDVRIER